MRSFNPTLVRFELTIDPVLRNSSFKFQSYFSPLWTREIVTYWDEYITGFNPTLVRFEQKPNIIWYAAIFGFNPTLVRFEQL